MRSSFRAMRGNMAWLYKALLYGMAAGAVLAMSTSAALGQPVANRQRGGMRSILAAPLNGSVGPAAAQSANATSGTDTNDPRGAGANADFDSLIDLIVSTVATETWAENGGGEADIRPFPNGVLVDAAGTLSLKSRVASAPDRELSARRGTAQRPNASTNNDARQTSEMRFVSLPRLEREIARRQAAHQPLDPSMLTLAGLQRVRYVFVYPESGDVVLAGPAGDWRVDADGRILSTESGQAVVRLDDLIVLWRRTLESPGSHFGCSINPRQEALANTQAFLASTSDQPIQPGGRKAWLAKLRDTVGQQDIEIWGVDPASRVASVLVEADYHMKLIGMGLVEGVDGVESYLASIRVPAGGSPPAMSVLRWWFALNYESVRSTPQGDAFELVGQAARVLSENELLAEQGQRIHTGQSDLLTQQFADDFTAHFTELAAKYPVYGELRNIFDLAMAMTLIQTRGLAEQVGWQPDVLSSVAKLRLPQAPVPRQVETVVSHRVINRRHIVAGVSGGVIVAPRDVLSASDKSEAAALRDVPRGTVPQDNVAAGANWWWDGEENGS